MKLFPKSPILALVVLLLPLQVFADDEPTPQRVTTAFYSVYMRTHPPGVPDVPMRKQFQPVISPALNDLLVEANKAEIAYKKKTKGEVPPLVEGDLFTSNFEGATSFSVASCEQNQQTAACAVDLTYADDTQPPPATSTPLKWQDKAFLTHTANGWKIDDIAYGGNWPFGNHGRLKDALADIPRAAKE